MRIFINEYIKVLAYSLIGLLFAYSAFYLIANIYHYQEIRKTYDKNIVEIDNYKKIKNNINKIKDNITVDSNNYTEETSLSVKQLRNNLSNCLTYLDNDYFKDLKSKEKVDIKDVENLRAVVSNDVINGCLIENIYYITYQNEYNMNFLEFNNQIIKSHIDSLNNQLYYINRDIQNNSSFYFNTKFINNNNYDKVGDHFNNLLDIYKESSDLVLIISDKYNKEVTNND